jgi:hypothetical protein
MTDRVVAPRRTRDRALTRVSVATAVRGLAYAGYRMYYACSGCSASRGC